ncbi:hypothetical protein NXV96_22695 [Bacteroides fragilis]|nr:hypothetical protein [Bacteroides fragilis]
MENLIFQLESHSFLLDVKKENIFSFIVFMENNSLLCGESNYFFPKNISKWKIKSTQVNRFSKNEENPFMKQAIEGIENHVVKKYKSSTGGDKKAVVALADTENFQKNEENPFMKQAIEGIENHVVKKYKSNSGGDKKL